MASILVSKDAGVLTITLNRPEKLNAFNPAMHQLLREAMQQAVEDAGVRAVLLTGAGRGFCAGQDLSERDTSAGAAPIDLSVSIGSHYNPLIRRLQELPKPIVCAVNGVAAGAGANIALACDLVLAAEDAVRWGLIWKAVEDDQLMAEAGILARQLASGPTRGYGLLKKALHASPGNSLDAQLDLERDLQREAGYSNDYREVDAAFMQKRKPEFKGK